MNSIINKLYFSSFFLICLNFLQSSSTELHDYCMQSQTETHTYVIIETYSRTELIKTLQPIFAKLSSSQHTSYTFTAYFNIYFECIVEIIRHDHCFSISVKTVSGTPIGGAVYFKMLGSSSELAKLWVHTQFRRSGFGAFIFNIAATHSTFLGCKTMEWCSGFLADTDPVSDKERSDFYVSLGAHAIPSTKNFTLDLQNLIRYQSRL